MLKSARQETQAATVLITHDLGLIAEVADRVVVMYAGRVVELGRRLHDLQPPRHPYTVGLMKSLARLDADQEWLEPIPGQPPSLITPPPGVRFIPAALTRRGGRSVEPSCPSSGQPVTAGPISPRVTSPTSSPLRMSVSLPQRGSRERRGGSGQARQLSERRRHSPHRGSRQALPDQGGPHESHRRAGARRRRRRPYGSTRGDAWPSR